MNVFLSTPSARRATYDNDGAGTPVRISIHALREEGDLFGTDDGFLVGISIHALREEGDDRAFVAHPVNPISIHALREEGDKRPCGREGPAYTFLSTPSARRATVFYHRTYCNHLFLSTPSARRATRAALHAAA